MATTSLFGSHTFANPLASDFLAVQYLLLTGHQDVPKNIAHQRFVLVHGETGSLVMHLHSPWMRSIRYLESVKRLRLWPVERKILDLGMRS